jgi:hypothetical protein
METSILKYLSKYNVLLCTACPESYCLPPGSVATHLRTLHRTILSKKQRATIVKYSDSLFIEDPKNIEVPPREQGPVPGLHLVEGFECLKCGYACPAENTMLEKHCRPKHGWRKAQSQMWKKQYIQVIVPYTMLLLLIFQEFFRLKSVSQIFPR